MGVYIKGIEMPTERESFNLTIKYNGTVLDTETGMQVAEAHELQPHGRLIDADALAKAIGITSMDCYECVYGSEGGSCTRGEQFCDVCADIEYAPTIIPASEEAEG